MTARIRKAMARRDEGFTLVELLVVVVIIGILTAIAIPTFLNQRNKAYDAAVKSDLKNIATSFETYYVDNSTYAATTVAYWTTDAATHVTKGTKYIVVGADATHYVVDGLSKSGNWFELDSSAGGAPTNKGSSWVPASGTVTIDYTGATQTITIH